MMNIPFDEDMNVKYPEPPPLPEDGVERKYTGFPSAEGYEQVPPGWKPRAGRELPALRCTYVRPDETRCKNFGVRGTGFNGTPSMCFIHGGSLPPVKKKAEATLLAAKMRLVENTGLALDTLIGLTDAGVADAIRLKASTEILDRAGVKGGMEIDLNVSTAIKPSEIIQEKLRTISETAKAKKELLAGTDAEIVDEAEADVDAEPQIIEGKTVEQ